MRIAISFAAAVIGRGLQLPAVAQTTIPCTNTGMGYLHCLPPIGSSNGEGAASRMNRETVERGVNRLFPPPPSSQELADRAVGRAMAANPQQSSEDEIDYQIRVTRMARDGIAQQSWQAGMMLSNRLVELENLQLRKQIAEREAQKAGEDQSWYAQYRACINRFPAGKTSNEEAAISVRCKNDLSAAPSPSEPISSFTQSQHQPEPDYACGAAQKLCRDGAKSLCESYRQDFKRQGHMCAGVNDGPGSTGNSAQRWERCTAAQIRARECD